MKRDKNIKITTKPILHLKILWRKWVKDVFICWKLINDKCLPKKYMMKTNYDLKKKVLKTTLLSLDILLPEKYIIGVKNNPPNIVNPINLLHVE
jgi:hypothetical protein